MISRRTAICLTAIGLSAVASIGAASAADYPSRAVRWVVGYPPGGATDIIARLIGQRLSEKLGQQFVIENKPGAGNNIATESVINAEPDGYTLLLVNPANYINATLYAKLKFNFVSDIAPVASFNRVPNVMTVGKDIAAKDVAEFIAYAKANPGNRWQCHFADVAAGCGDGWVQGAAGVGVRGGTVGWGGAVHPGFSKVSL